ncbi:MAG: rRNA maturation RNase YbeY [Chlamydiae bacterium]|nr:rRNA maturation RNase YbeY [Chlamydiota bacterium]
MQIYFKNSQKDLKVPSSSVKKLIHSLLKKLKVECDEISLHFVTTRKISELHADFFNDPSTTDCITFPIDDDSNSYYRVLGEIFVCPKTALTYAQKKGRDPYEETTLYVVHGILHLLGFDDIDPKDRTQMRKKERACMTYLKKESLLLSKKKVVLNYRPEL